MAKTNVSLTVLKRIVPKNQDGAKARTSTNALKKEKRGSREGSEEAIEEGGQDCILEEKIGKKYQQNLVLTTQSCSIISFSV